MAGRDSSYTGSHHLQPHFPVIARDLTQAFTWWEALHYQATPLVQLSPPLTLWHGTTVDEPTLIHCMYGTNICVYPPHCIVCRFWQLSNMYLLWWSGVELLWKCPMGHHFSLYFLLWALGNHWSFYCLHSFDLSRMSWSWNCSLALSFPWVRT